MSTTPDGVSGADAIEAVKGSPSGARRNPHNGAQWGESRKLRFSHRAQNGLPGTPTRDARSSRFPWLHIGPTTRQLGRQGLGVSSTSTPNGRDVAKAGDGEANGQREED